MSNYSDILYKEREGMAWVTINRPKVLNAFTPQTLDELQDALVRAAQSHDVGVVVLTGTGERAFCSGGDVNFEASDEYKDHEYKLHEHIVDCPKPVIARVNGYAIGGGNHMAYFCDFTIAAEHAIFGQNGPRVGSPAGGATVAQAANVIGHKRAREMWMLCRRYTAQQMFEWGLVNAVVPMAELDAEVLRWRDDLLTGAPTCLKILKASFKKHMEPILRYSQAGTIQETAPGYFETGEQQEGAAAFLEKRKPDFSPWR